MNKKEALSKKMAALGRKGAASAKKTYKTAARRRFIRKFWKGAGMTVKDVAVRLGITRQAIHQKIKSGEIVPPEPKKFGKRKIIIWTEGDILRILQARDKVR